MIAPVRAVIIAAAIGLLVAGPWGLAMAPLIVTVHLLLPRVGPWPGIALLGLMTAAVILEAPLNGPGFGFVVARPLSHRIGLILVLAVGIASVLGRGDPAGPGLAVQGSSNLQVREITGPRRGLGGVTVLAVAMAAVAVLLVALTPGGMAPGTAVVACCLFVPLGVVAVGVTREVKRLRRGASGELLPDDPPALAALAQYRGGSDLAPGVIIGSTWLLAGTIIVSVGSFLYWVIAARHVSPEALGGGAALFSSAFFLTYLTGLGLPIAVTRFASQPTSEADALFSLAVALTTLSSLVGAVGFVLIAPERVLAPVGGVSMQGVTTMFLIVAALSISVVIDARLTGLRRWRTVFWRTSAIAVLRLVAFVFIPADDDGLWIFLVGAGAYGATALVLLPGLFRTGGRFPMLRPRVRKANGFTQFAAVNYLGQLGVQAPFYLTPLVVLVAVTSEENGSFYLAWGVTSVVLVGVQVVAQTQLAEGSHGGDRRRQAVTSLLLGLAVTGGAAVVAVAASGAIAGLFGAGFAPVASHLPLLVPGCVPWTFTMVALTVARLAADTRSTLRVSIPYALFGLGGVVIGVIAGGAVGASAGWLVGNCLSLLVSVPLLARALRVPEASRQLNQVSSS